MRVTVLTFVACILLGAALSQHWLPFGAGFLGALIILMAACWLRARWHADRSAPETAERSALLSVASTLVCLGYFAAMLYQIGPGLDVHSGITRKMANELWILIAGSAAAQWVARAPRAMRDELDDTIAAQALASSCHVLLALQALLVVCFGLLFHGGQSIRSVDMLVHLFIGSWMVAHVCHGLSRVRAYAALRAAHAGSP